ILMIGGIDEAGRGCIIGPMVISLALISPMEEYKLKELGVKDSKLLSKNKRKRLFYKIQKICKIKKIVISAEQINQLMEEKNLNEIEAYYCAKLLENSKCTKVYIDSPDPEPKNFEKRIRKYLKDKKIEIIAQNKADDIYPIVGAASIIAKVTRDLQIEKIKNEIGDFNSGYTSDPQTIKFLAENLNREEVKKYIRKKWITLKKLKQKRIFEY
ncbi:MAG: ribonuclease HII, partial [Candidatus Micrarchaeota archaeon]|nr:ribonuclease HII [Candidatus Micrarchaeota archaeon]